ncbi:hypothetical protein [Streptomyces virginiae]|uniref:hypothetical protein n=1 Tax=Streptomyces virginiae TaxID=1961 RepID=UPI0036F72FEE
MWTVARPLEAYASRRVFRIAVTVAVVSVGVGVQVRVGRTGVDPLVVVGFAGRAVGDPPPVVLARGVSGLALNAALSGAEDVAAEGAFDADPVGSGVEVAVVLPVDSGGGEGLLQYGAGGPVSVGVAMVFLRAVGGGWGSPAAPPDGS